MANELEQQLKMETRAKTFAMKFLRLKTNKRTKLKTLCGRYIEVIQLKKDIFHIIYLVRVTPTLTLVYEDWPGLELGLFENSSLIMEPYKTRLVDVLVNGKSVNENEAYLKIKDYEHNILHLEDKASLELIHKHSFEETLLNTRLKTLEPSAVMRRTLPNGLKLAITAHGDAIMVSTPMGMDFIIPNMRPGSNVRDVWPLTDLLLCEAVTGALVYHFIENCSIRVDGEEVLKSRMNIIAESFITKLKPSITVLLKD